MPQNLSPNRFMDLLLGKHCNGETIIASGCYWTEDPIKAFKDPKQEDS